jgi:hypothetical protein
MIQTSVIFGDNSPAQNAHVIALWKNRFCEQPARREVEQLMRPNSASPERGTVWQSHHPQNIFGSHVQHLLPKLPRVH